MARTIEKGATRLDKLCHKIYDEPKGFGFQVDGECIRCGGPLLDYYCEERLHLIVCKKCGTLALTKACAPQVAANLTLSRKPTLTQPNEPLTIEQLREMDGEPAWWDDGDGSCWGIISVDSAGMWGGMPFFRGRWREVNFEYNIEERGMKIYRRPPEKKKEER